MKIQYCILLFLFFFCFVPDESQCKSYKKSVNKHAAKKNSSKSLMRKRFKKVQLNMNTKDSCWMSLDAGQHIKKMGELENKYAAVRKEFQMELNVKKFDKELLQAILAAQGVAGREIQHHAGYRDLIPAGLHLGGYGMMRLPTTLLFFHRMKLRNDTHFRVNYLASDFEQMTLTGRISLNDLHLVGAYERCKVGQDRSDLFYEPTRGEVEFLLQNVEYKMEGRFRMIANRLFIEHIISEVNPKAVLMAIRNSSSETVAINRNNLDEYLLKIQNDLDSWLKDYFNDYLIYYGLADTEINSKFQKYEQIKTAELTDYMDNVLAKLRMKVNQVKGTAVRAPRFTIFGNNGLEFKIKNGVIRGLETMYRRSVATGKRNNSMRHVNAIVGFGSLKVEYTYEAFVRVGMPPVTGLLVLTADDLTASLAVTLVEGSETVDLQFRYHQQITPETLTLEGPVSRVISNFRRVLELHIISLLSNQLIFSVRMLSTLPRCETVLAGVGNSLEYLHEVSGIPPSDPGLTPDNDKPEPGQNLIPNIHEKKTLEYRPDLYKPKYYPKAGAPYVGPVDEHNSSKEINNHPLLDQPVDPVQHEENEIPVGTSSKTADYALEKHDSVELVIPPEHASGKEEKMVLHHDVGFRVHRIKNNEKH